MSRRDATELEIRPAVYALLMAPLLYLAGSVGFVMVPDETMTDIEQVRSGIWPVIWVGLCLASVALTIGLGALTYQSWRLGARLSAVFGFALPMVHLPMVLTVWGVGSFMAIGMLDPNSLIYVEPQYHEFAMNIVEGFNDGLILLFTAVLGAGVVFTSGAMKVAELGGTILVGAGYLVGSLAIVLGLALLVTTQATPMFSLIILSQLLIHIWAGAAGIKLLRA